MRTKSLTKADFDGEIAALLRLKDHVATRLRPAVEAILKFANAYRTLHQRIGPNYDRRVALRRRLGLDEYQHQRLMAIAAQSKTLGQFTRALPPAVEPLYEIARLTKDAAGEKRLRAAIQRHEVTPTSGIREIRGIRQSTRRRASKPHPPKVVEHPSSLAFVVEADELRAAELIEQFTAELVTLVEKYGLRVRTGGAQRNGAQREQRRDRHDDERARLDRIFSAPALNRAIADEDLNELPAEPRAALTRELLECHKRHMAEWEAARKAESEDVGVFFDRMFNDAASTEMQAFSHEILEIAAKHGVPRAIAALKGQISPEVRQAYVTAKTMLGRDRAARDRQEDDDGGQPKRRRSAREDRQRAKS